MTPRRAASLSFQAKLERIATDAEYFALPVPLKVSRALGTRGPVPVHARVNGSESFLISLFPVGGGRHYLRVKAAIRKAANIKEGDRARVEITVRDRTAEVSVPEDLASALRAERLTGDFESLPIGKRSYSIRRIEEAAKPETRAKRVQEAVEAAQGKREKRLDRGR